MKRFTFKTLLLVLSLGFLGCQYSVEKSVDSSFEPNSKTSANLNFAKVNEQIIKPKCVHCHNNADKNSGGVNLESFESVIAALSDIQSDIRSGDMPRAPITPLNSDEKNMILSWIQMGAPKDSAPVNEPPPSQNPQPTPTPVPVDRDLPTLGLEAKFSSIYSLIIKVKCLECHQAGGDAELIPFEKYSDLVFGKMIIPYDPGHSILPKHLVPGVKKVMPPPKSKYKILAEEDFNIIIDWIKQGAANN